MKVLVLVVILLMSNQSWAQKIDSIRCYTIDVKTAEKKHTKTQYYNASNQLAKTIKYYKGKEEGIEAYFYDTTGHLIEYINTKNERKYIVKSTYEGHLLVEEDVTGFVPRTTVYKYNAQGAEILKQDCTNKSTIDKIIETKYVYEGDLPIRINIFETRPSLNSRPEMRQQKLYKYNEKGLVVKEEITSMFYRVIHVFEYHDNDNLKTQITLRFDSKSIGNPTADTDEKVIKVFNEAGLRIEEDIYRKKDKEAKLILEQTNAWVYDIHGNEIESKVSKGEELTRHEKKEIFYKK